MSDNIPFDIQMEIIKKAPHVKSLIRFRSVSKQWKSFIDTSEFIKGYSTQAHSHILSYKSDYSWDYEANYFLEDVDIETFKVQKQEVTPLLKQYRCPFFVGACHGLLCWNGYNKINKKEMVVIWNPSIRKSIGVALPKYRHDLWIGYQRVYGFGVCHLTSDPTVIEVLCADNMHWYENKPWHVKVFTLSSGVWNVIPTANLPRQSITLDNSTPVVIDRFIYWGASENILTKENMLVSFDLITKGNPLLCIKTFVWPGEEFIVVYG
ncbi:probable galacturonosyltransferase 7 isoform X2 [Tanacetum coccineum]